MARKSATNKWREEEDSKTLLLSTTLGSSGPHGPSWTTRTPTGSWISSKSRWFHSNGFTWNLLNTFLEIILEAPSFLSGGLSWLMFLFCTFLGITMDLTQDESGLKSSLGKLTIIWICHMRGRSIQTWTEAAISSVVLWVGEEAQ